MLIAWKSFPGFSIFSSFTPLSLWVYGKRNTFDQYNNQGSSTILEYYIRLYENQCNGSEIFLADPILLITFFGGSYPTYNVFFSHILSYAVFVYDSKIQLSIDKGSVQLVRQTALVDMPRVWFRHHVHLQLKMSPEEENSLIRHVKQCVSRDFRPLQYFCHGLTPSWSLMNRLESNRIQK